MEKYIKQAHQLWREGREEAMLIPLKRALNIAEEKQDIYKIIEIKSEYGGVLRVVGHLEEAIEVLNDVVFLIKENFGQEHEQYNTALVNLANAYRMKGAYEAAENCFYEAKNNLENLEQINYTYFSLCNNLALLLQEKGQYQKAMDLLKFVIHKMKDIEDYQIPLGISYNNMATVCSKQDNMNGAIGYCHQAKEILSRVVGVNHPLYAATMSIEAEICYKNGEYLASLQLYQGASQIIKNTYGEKSSDYIHLQENISEIKQLLQDKLQPPQETMASEGMLLSFQFVTEQVFPYLLEQHPQLLSKLAIGLVGPGSECFGYDDELSKDHDYFARCYCFISDALWESYYSEMKQVKDKFNEQVTFMSVETFYEHYTGYPKGPYQPQEYLTVDDHHLATATNGCVFIDFDGAFTQIREHLTTHYPNDIFYKRLAYHCTQIAQAGQYNYSRLAKRDNQMGMLMSLAEFVKHYSACIHLINKKYMPFYKWYERSIADCPILGQKTLIAVKHILNHPQEVAANIKSIELLCKDLITYFNKEKMTNTTVDFMTYQAEELMEKIIDPSLRASNPWLLKEEFQ